MAAHTGRLLRQWPMWQQHCCSNAALHHLIYSPLLPVTTRTNSRCPSLTTIHLSTRGVHKLLRGLRRSDYQDANSTASSSSGSDSDAVTYKSRNELKRHARRAVRWAMDLASFSTPQIKRIVRVASVDQDVLDAVILVKKLGPDVREGKRRQFNYIGKLLRDVEADLMDALIQATKDSDESKLQALSGQETLGVDVADAEEAEETDYGEEEEGSHIDEATRWFDGLVSKDNKITNEVYSISSVEFDRQELRKLVRSVHSRLEQKVDSEENTVKIDAARVRAEKALTRFLRSLAKRSLEIDI